MLNNPKEEVRENKEIQKQQVEKKSFWDYIFKILIVIVNLVISVIENLQFLFVSIVVTIAAIIIIKYTQFDITSFIDKGVKLLRK